MIYTVDTTIAGASAGDPTTIYHWALNAGAQRPADVLLYLNEVYRLSAIAGLRAEVVVAQSIHETSDVNTGAPWSSAWWIDRCNPAGMGVTGDPAQNDASPTFANGTAAAQAHVVHLFLYAVGATLPAGMAQDWDPRWQAAVDAGRAGCAPTIAGLTNTWGMDTNYANALLGRLIALSKVMGNRSDTTPAPATTPPAPGATTMASPFPGGHTVTIPGLDGGPLELSFPLDTATYMINASNTYQRPGISLQPAILSVQHGTGNPNSLAAGDAAWVHGGADGIQESMHFEVDDTEGFQLIPVNEVSWQAADGAGPGNMSGVSCEMSENADLWADETRRGNLIRNCAELLGRIAARKNIAIPQQHYDFNYNDPNRHDCPYQLRHVAGAWDQYVTLWQAAKADELARMGKPVWAPKHPLPRKTLTSNGTAYFCFPSPVTLKATSTVTPREWAGADAAATGPDIAAGTNASFSHITADSSGALWLIGTGGSRCPLAAFI